MLAHTHSLENLVTHLSETGTAHVQLAELIAQKVIHIAKTYPEPRGQAGIGVFTRLIAANSDAKSIHWLFHEIAEKFIINLTRGKKIHDLDPDTWATCIDAVLVKFAEYYEKQGCLEVAEFMRSHKARRHLLLDPSRRILIPRFISSNPLVGGSHGFDQFLLAHDTTRTETTPSDSARTFVKNTDIINTLLYLHKSGRISTLIEAHRIEEKSGYIIAYYPDRIVVHGKPKAVIKTSAKPDKPTTLMDEEGNIDPLAYHDAMDNIHADKFSVKTKKVLEYPVVAQFIGTNMHECTFSQTTKSGSERSMLFVSEKPDGQISIPLNIVGSHSLS